MDVALRFEMTVEERPLHRGRGAVRRKKLSLTAASLTVMPVVRIDGRPVGDGKPGPVALRSARAEFHRFANFS